MVKKKYRAMMTLGRILCSRSAYIIHESMNGIAREMLQICLLLVSKDQSSCARFACAMLLLARVAGKCVLECRPMRLHGMPFQLTCTYINEVVWCRHCQA